MLNAVLLAVALFAQDPFGDEVHIGQTSIVKSKTSLKDTPNGKKQVWTETRAEVVVVTGDHDDFPPIVSAVAVMRPEKPAKNFIMDSVLVGPPDGVPIESEVPGAAIGFDYGSNSMGAELGALIEKGKNSALERFAGYSVKVNPNEDIRPGGWTRRTYAHEKVLVDVRVRIYSRAMQEGGPEGEWEIIDGGGVGTYEWHVPMSRPIKEEFFPDAEKTMPEEVPHFGIPDDGKWGMPGGTFNLPLPTPGTGGTAPGNFGGEIWKTGTKPIGFELPPGSAGSMNEISYPAGSITPGYTASFPPGTLWYPSTPGYQVVANRQWYRYGMITATIAPEPISVRINCMNMHLKEPSASVKYYPMMNNDPISAAIMNLPQISNRTLGPDQARTWIFTDKANLKEINEKLVPPIDAGYYLTALYQVASANGLTPADLDKKGMADPALLPEASAKKEAVRWLMSRLESKRPKDVAAWLNGKPDLLLLLFEQSNAAYGDRGQYVLNELLGSPSPEIRTAALKLIDGLGSSAMPHLDGRLPNLTLATLSGKKDEAELAWKVAQKYNQKLPKWALNLLATSKTSKTVADGAKAQLGG
jgi:hypothetical protein